MTYSRDELTQFTLQKLASIYPATLEDEALLKEIFESRASVSSYFTLTSLVDVKAKWQEEIVQKYVDEKRESMAPENPASLTPEEEALLEPGVVTKENELKLQASLDAKNHKKAKEVEITADEPIEESTENEEIKPTSAKIGKKVKANKK